MKKRWTVILGILFFCSCAPKVFKAKWTKEVAPERYTARFETTKGSFDVAVTRKYSPKAADRFYQLVKHHCFDNAIFYRVYPDFVAQFGSSDTITYQKWSSHKVPDEEVVQANKKGTLSFARSGKETRTTDLFINLKDNTHLDTITYEGVTGFPSFGVVTQGMSVVEALHSEHADTTMDTLDLMYSNREAFMDRFPSLDLIEQIRLIQD